MWQEVWLYERVGAAAQCDNGMNDTPMCRGLAPLPTECQASG